MVQKVFAPLLGERHRNVCGHPRPARAASRCTPRVAGSHFPRRCLCGVHERPRRRPGYSCRVQGRVLRRQRLEQSREVPLQCSSLHLALLTRGPPARAPRPPPSLGVSETHLRGPFSFRYAEQCGLLLQPAACRQCRPTNRVICARARVRRLF
jgi:hypothetical protein